MTIRRLVRIGLGIASAMVCALSAGRAAADQSWTLLDTRAGACHTYLAFPYATNCDFAGGQGYQIQINCGVDCWLTDPRGGRGQSLARSTNQNLWTVASDGSVWARTGTWSGGSWTNKPLNACGTGAAIQFNQDNGVQILAVGTDPSNRDVPWVVDATGTVRFWRTKFTPACWAALPQVPGQGTITSIGIYDDPSVTPDNLPWVTRENQLYLYAGGQWTLIDGDTGGVSSNGSYVTNTSGTSLWTYKFAAGWSLDASWDATTIARLSSDPGPGKLSLITWDNKVWLHAQPL